MIREVDLVSYLPPFLAEYRDINETFKAEDPEFQIVWQAADRVLRNEFIATADEYGITRFENILKIFPAREDTLESRRARVQSKWFLFLPYTMKMLLVRLIAICGENNFKIIRHLEEYHLTVETDLELYGQVDELDKTLQALLPCNMVITVKNKIPCVAQGKIFAAGGTCSMTLVTATDKEDG